MAQADSQQATGGAQNTSLMWQGVTWPVACPALTQSLHGGEPQKAVDLHETIWLSHIDKQKPFFLKSKCKKKKPTQNKKKGGGMFVFKVPVLLRGLQGRVHRQNRKAALLINKKR